MSINDYRPISLINCSIKLLLKVLANMIKPILPSLISEHQTAFIKGSNINESILMVDEVIHSMKMFKIYGVIIKLDFSKAYDSMDWSCLMHTLSCLNFGTKWRNWIRALLHSVKMSVLVNGSPTEKFAPTKGLRQGDPLAPYLFLIIGEILTKLISRSQQFGGFQGIKFPFSQDRITYFQYADDTILFVENNRDPLAPYLFLSVFRWY